jgi:hypothetical protein
MGAQRGEEIESGTGDRSRRIRAGAAVARALRDVLVGVVEKGTARRIKAETARPGTLPHCFEAVPHGPRVHLSARAEARAHLRSLRVTYSGDGL